jgi:hypothetical protein
MPAQKCDEKKWTWTIAARDAQNVDQSIGRERRRRNQLIRDFCVLTHSRFDPMAAREWRTFHSQSTHWHWSHLNANSSPRGHCQNSLCHSSIHFCIGGNCSQKYLMNLRNRKSSLVKRFSFFCIIFKRFLEMSYIHKLRFGLFSFFNQLDLKLLMNLMYTTFLIL